MAPVQLADFVVLDQDLRAIERDGIGQVGVLATVVGDDMVFDRMGLAT